MSEVMETKLETMGKVAVVQAKTMTIADPEQYTEASVMLKENKQMQKEVEAYWAEPKQKAKAVHQSVVDREKAMLLPLVEAEKIIKGAMVSYQNAVAKARYEAEQEAKRLQRIEAERLMNQAIVAEENGNQASAAVTMAMAQMVEDMVPGTGHIEAPVAAGISTRKVWKARVVNESAVPVSTNGMIIRPVDLSALNQLARMGKGTLSIPGVEFYEESVLSART